MSAFTRHQKRKTKWFRQSPNGLVLCVACSNPTVDWLREAAVEPGQRHEALEQLHGDIRRGLEHDPLHALRAWRRRQRATVLPELAWLDGSHKWLP
jgi:hypothetical protein